MSESTWVAPEPAHTDPPIVADEREMLISWLEFHRALLLKKCAGLTAEQLKERSSPPSSLSLLGLVRHMSDVERGWFRQLFVAEDVPDLYYTEADRDADFNDIADADAEADFAIFAAECEAARQIIAAAPSLDDVSAKKTRKGNLISLRWIMVHMIEEYARHNGHADLIRERIDGVVGDWD
ncbi:MAG TPA: DinB family protein [Streptosporangiaceae bacterium]|nr:DinB family protein [Streptosporangiaceae bacterium]